MYYPLLTSGALNSLFFGVYGVSLEMMNPALAADKARPKAQQRGVKPSNMEIFVAGCFGGVAQLSVACPVELAKIQLQVQTGKEKNYCQDESGNYGKNDLAIPFAAENRSESNVDFFSFPLKVQPLNWARVRHSSKVRTRYCEQSTPNTEYTVATRDWFPWRGGNWQMTAVKACSLL